jgi:5-methylcytosine-specific restriction endonuclease McrA
MLKMCHICFEEKDVLFFCKNKNNIDKLSIQCKSCAKYYRDTHKEEKSKYLSSNVIHKQKYAIDNKDRANFLRREKRRNNPEKTKTQAKINYLRNKIKIRAKQKLFYIKNIAYFQIKSKKYRNQNVESILLRNRQRKSRLKSYPTIKQSEIDCLLKTNNHQCLYCGIKVMRKSNLHIDHKVPLVRNGSHTIENMAPSCMQCNLQKGTKTSEEFIKLLSGNNNAK